MSLSHLLPLFLGLTLGADLPEDYRLPPPPGPFATPEASAATGFAAGDPLIATTYFYWYDVGSKGHILDGDGSDALTDHPPTMEGFSYRNVDWHAAQLDDMTAAGIDVLMPVYWGTPLDDFAWSDHGLPPLIAARERLISQGKRPPMIGMFYDTSTLKANAKHYHVDLTTPSGRRWFYGTIRNFFSSIPARHRARIDGKPLVFLYTSAFAKEVDETLFPAVRKLFHAEFGSDIYLVKMAGWPGESDSVYQWGAALSPRFLATAAIGPGYDHSAVPGRDPLVRERLDGGFYRFAWEKLLAMDPVRRPWLVHLETWNEFHEGTQICETAEYGRQYIDLTRRYADQFHGRKRIAEPFVPVQQKRVTARPEKSAGLRIASKTRGDGPISTSTVGSRPAWSTTRNRYSESHRFMYFDVDNFFLLDGDEPIEVTVGYFDSGPAEFRFEYDSSDPALKGLARQFRTGHRQPITNSKTWKEVTFIVPHARFGGGANNSDFRLACEGADLSVSHLSLRRPR